MLGLLRFVSWPHFQRHRLRTFLTFSGIVLGVSTIVAIAIVNRTLLTSFRRTIDLVAGKAVLQVQNGESGLREALYPVIRDTAGVKDAAPVVEGFLPVVGFKGERLFVYGVDFLGDSSIRQHEFSGTSLGFESALDFIARRDSIALTETLSRRLRIPMGSRITLVTSRGVQSYTVRALLEERGAAKVFGGNFALMDLPVAQMALGKDGKIDLVDLTIQEGEKIETVKNRIQSRLQGSAQVERPQKRSEQIESLLTSFRVGLFFVSLVALFVGFFLIYNTESVSVVQRRREIGTLRCLGVLRRDILILFMLEALFVAFFGSLVGFFVGALLAQGALLVVGKNVSDLFLQVELAKSGLTWRELWIALASGMGVSLLAALYPALQATRVTPLENVRQAIWSPRNQGVSRVSVFGLALLLLFPLFLFFPAGGLGRVQRFTLGMVAMLILLLALSLLSPLLIRSLARLLRRVLQSSSWTEAKLAIDSLERNAVRSGITLATLLISLATTFTVVVLVYSVRFSLLSWVDQMVPADLIVSQGTRTAGPMNTPLPEELEKGLKAIPGVRVVDMTRLIRSTYNGKPIFIRSFSARASQGVRKLPLVGGEGNEALRRMGAGEGVLVSESFQTRFGKGAGDTISLPTPSGFKSFRVLGVYVDYASDAGSVLLDRALYKVLWRDQLVNAFGLWLAPGADQEVVIRQVKEDYGEKYQLFVSTHAELRDAVIKIMEQTFIVNYAVEIVAVIVALFSVINTLLASVLDRTREIGVLRAIGATQRQLRLMIMAEAGWMGCIGGLLGLFAGTVMSYHHVVYNTKVLTGWTFQYFYPFHIALLCFVLSVILCLWAGYIPARRAAAINIVTAIGYE